MHALTRALSGTATLTSAGGAIAGVNVEQVLRRLERNPLSGIKNPGGGRTAFDNLSAKLRVTNGTARVEEAQVESPQVRLNLSGEASVVYRDFNLRGTAMLRPGNAANSRISLRSSISRARTVGQPLSDARSVVAHPAFGSHGLGLSGCRRIRRGGERTRLSFEALPDAFSGLRFIRPGTLALAVAALLLCGADVRAQQIELTVTPLGGAASGRPLPVGAMPSVKVAVRNAGATAIGPVELTARFHDLAPGENEGWRSEDGALKAVHQADRRGCSDRARASASCCSGPGRSGKCFSLVRSENCRRRSTESSIQLSIADCVGAYRGRLEAMRPTLSQPVRDAADEIRKADPALPAARQFPPTGARSGDLARAERLAATFASRRGADPQMSTEWFRFLLQRWASELNAYTGQAANPGLCANNYYQIAGYRQGLLPVTKHLAATSTAADAAREALRKATETDSGNIDEIVRSLIESAELEVDVEKSGALDVLAEARALLRNGRKLEADLARKFSLAETAAWLAESDRRGKNLVQSIEQVLSAIARAHKESCVCAF
jgi:hypothetical protein